MGVWRVARRSWRVHSRRGRAQLAATLRDVAAYVASAVHMRPARFLGIPADYRLVLSFVSLCVSAVSFALYTLNVLHRGA